MFAFRLGRIPVRVHLFFLLMAVMLGGNQPGPLLVSWIAVVFFSVLLHELGHALMGKVFGLSPEIDLHGMGGTTSWGESRARLSPGPHILISLAGPFAGIAFGILVLLVASTRQLSPTGAAVVDQLRWVNIGWGILNLIPMLPLDGGNVMARVLDIFTKGRGRKPAHVISAAIALGLILYVLFARGGLSAILRGNLWAAWPVLLATLFLVQNVKPLLPPKEEKPEEE